MGQQTAREKSHEKQFEFNATIMDKMEDATSALQQTPPAVEKARPAWQKVWLLLNLGKSILGLQIGLNRSEFGWAAVVDLFL